MTGIRFLFLLITLWVGALFLTPVRSAEEEQTVSGDVRASTGFYGVVFYYATEAPASTKEELQKLAEELLPGVPFTGNPGKETKPPFLVFEEEAAPLKDFPVPEASYFRHAGRGLSDADIRILQKTPKATHVMFVIPAAEVWKDGRLFTELVLRYAEKSGAYVWDSATRECFTAKAWKETRLDSWPPGDSIPDLSRQFTIHLYKPEQSSLYLRAITLGMEKFALPDVVIEQLTASDRRPAGNLINLSCQFLAENPVITDGKDCLIDAARIKKQDVRDRFKEGYLEGATGKIRLALLQGKTKPGDPDNDLIELDFRNLEGTSVDEKRNKAFSGLWGSSDSIVKIRHDDEILEASQRARGRLPDLRKKILEGLKPGERLLLKAPFERDDEGNEWMWVEVMEWKKEEEIRGILQNDPFYIKKLKAGTAVTLQTSEVFDYLYYKADGSTEGNETGKLMQKQQGEIKKK